MARLANTLAALRPLSGLGAKRPFLRRLLLTAVLLSVLVLLPAFTLAPVAPAWTPAPLKWWAYDMRLLIGRPLTTLASLQQAVQGETAVWLADEGERIQFESDGLLLTGTVYGADEAASQPGILLLHGSTPQGRKLGLYRLLGRELAAQGFVVLTLDQRGYGQSGNPPDLNEPASFDFAADVQAALTLLSALPGVNGDDIYLIGHSFGGDVAMTAVAEQETAVDKLIIIGPGRRFMERGGTPQQAEFDYFRRREQRYMALWQLIPAAVFTEYRATLPLENHLDYFDGTPHVPTLFVDGALESAADKSFLADEVAGMAATAVYDTIDDADHYANVANFGPLIIYDETAVGELVKVIVAFLNGP